MARSRWTPAMLVLPDALQSFPATNYRPNDWCRAHGAQIIFGTDPQPFRAGLTFSGPALRASHPWRFCIVISFSACHRQVGVLPQHAGAGLMTRRVGGSMVAYSSQKTA